MTQCEPSIMERVSVIQGRNPLIVVAPHGYDQDDQNTDLMAETIAGQLDCFAVINRGWERSEAVDYLRDKADCNNVVHCMEDVVREEFLEPIIRFKDKVLTRSESCYIFYIHGMSNRHRKSANDPALDIVVGHGAGSPNSYTCELWQKDFMLHELNRSGIKAYEGKKGGSMSGWSRNNLNQYFRKWELEKSVNSMQLEVIYELRRERDLATLTADYLAVAMGKLLKAKSWSGNSKWPTY